MRPSALLGLLFALLTPLPGAEPPASRPELPPGAFAHWHADHITRHGPEITLTDELGHNHVTINSPSFTLSPDGTLSLDGTQPAGIRIPAKQPVAKNFILGADVFLDPEGPEFQTIAYLYRFCELRYRRSRGELSFNVWQTVPDEPGREVVASVTVRVPAGRWIRVRGVIDDAVATLSIDDTRAETRLGGSWELLPRSVVFLIGHGGADRPFRGRINHLYLAHTP